MTLNIEKEFQDLIPPLSNEERKQLEENIQEHGCRDPLVVWQGILVDGHNRYEICTRNGIEFDTVDMQFDSRHDAMLWMIDNQRARRNLSKQAWLQLGFKRAELLRPKAEENIREGAASHKGNQYTGVEPFQKSEKPPIEPINTVKEAADYAGVSVDTAAKFKRVMSDAPEEIKNAMASQEMSINESYNRMKAQNRIEDNVHKIELDSKTKAVDTVDITTINSFVVRDENMLKLSSEPSPSRLGIGDWVLSLNDDTINTVTRLSRFFHRETMIEFSLREYADVQTFPRDYKFIGLDSEIKSQIGNAVAPKMGEYISRNLKGKTCGDLFSGAGGFSCGLHKHGIKSLWAVEWETHAAQSFKLNNPDARVVNTNIAKLNPSDFDAVDIIIGGPPCQGFSSANSNNSGKRSFKSDPRNELYKEFLRFVNELRPAEFIMENVAQIMDVKDEIIADFEESGYSVTVEIVYGPDIGIKQTRKRCFFIGLRK